MVFHALLTDITLDHAQRISIDPGEAVAWVVVRSKFMIAEFKRQSYLWVDGGEGECRRQRCDFRVQLWSLVAMFQHGWD